MNELEIKMRTNILVRNMVENFMTQNNLSASAVIDALNAEIANLYPRMQQEYFAAVDEQRQLAAQEQQKKEGESEEE
jgi:hypothetical protein